MTRVFVLYVYLSVCTLWTTGQHIRDSPKYSNLWVAKVNGGKEVAQRVARDLGYTYMGQCGELEDYYEFIREDHPEVSLRDSGHLTESLLDLDEVIWAKQQLLVKISVGGPKRLVSERPRDNEDQTKDNEYNELPTAYRDRDTDKFEYEVPVELVEQGYPSDQTEGHTSVIKTIGELLFGCFGSEPSYSKDEQQEYITSFLKQQAKKRGSMFPKKNGKSIFSSISFPSRITTYLASKGQSDLSKLGTFSTEPAPASQLYDYSKGTTKPIKLYSEKISAYVFTYSDPYWRQQWNLQDYRTTDMPVMDLNVVPVHNRGITGQGITVAVVDNGVEHDNFDFGERFVSRLSVDFCKGITKPELQETEDHGTMCAGVIVMQPNNDACGVGIAYGANIVGLRAICPGEQAESITAKAFSHGNQEIDIYSSSWNMDSDGDYPFRRVHLDDVTVYRGTKKGRNGKGSIYVQSAGNNKDEGDNCAFKPHVNSPYIIPIGSASQLGSPTYFSERCTAVFATTYSKSLFFEGIVAPSLKGKCETSFTGNSAACPQAAGIIALVLSANKELTYRDVMHLITMSAEVAPLADNPNTWYKNGRGFWVSNDFGFGLMNAENMVNLAEKWVRVPEKRECTFTVNVDEPIELSGAENVKVSFDASTCTGTDDEIEYLEHIEITPVVEYPVRGDISIYLTSPEGTYSQILQNRYTDKSNKPLDNINIVSVHNWGERAQGTWTIEFKISILSNPRLKGYVHDFTVTFHGTLEKPAHYATKRTYAAFRLPKGTTMETELKGLYF